MKTIKLLIALILLGGAGFAPQEAKSQQVNVSFSVFHSELGRFGRWVNTPRYGQVWIYSEPGFRPYFSRGHWEYTNFGWTWVSDYPWGWAAFHYGRWELDPYYGWIWIPDYEWAPAWVTWSQYDGGYGWAPLGFRVSLNISFGAIPYNRWVFVSRQDICRPDFYRYRVNPPVHHVHNAVIINNIYVNNNIRFARGPHREEVERYTNRPIRQRTIEYGQHGLLADNHRPASRNDIQRPTRPPATGTPATGIDRPINRPGSGINNGIDRERPGIGSNRPVISPERKAGIPEKPAIRQLPQRNAAVDRMEQNGTPGSINNNPSLNTRPSIERNSNPAINRRPDRSSKPAISPRPERSSRPDFSRPSAPAGARNGTVRQRPTTPSQMEGRRNVPEHRQQPGHNSPSRKNNGRRL